MGIQYVDANADAVTSLSETYNISSTNNALAISIDGGSTQNFTLSSGVSQTAANIVTDLTALTGAVVSVVNINGANFVRIRTNSANSNSSSVVFGTPTHDACSTLGFVVGGSYFGGVNTNQTFVVNTKQNLIDGIETALLNAGWITISGHATSNLQMQSSMSPYPQDLRCRINVKDNGNNCVVISIQNVSGSKVGGNSSTNGIQLLPGTSTNWTVIANKYQAFVLVQGSNVARKFGGFGVPNLPLWLEGVVYEAIWANGNAGFDTDSTIRGSFRGNVGFFDPTNGSGNQQFICNGNQWDWGNNVNWNIGNGTLVVMWAGAPLQTGAATYYRWHDGSTYLTDPILSWGLTANTDEGLGRGQLWDSFVAMDSYAVDTILSSIDSHNWFGLTASNAGSNNSARGTVFVVTP